MVEISIEFILGILGVGLAGYAVFKARLHKVRVLVDAIAKFVDDYDAVFADDHISDTEAATLIADAKAIYIAAEDVLNKVAKGKML